MPTLVEVTGAEYPDRVNDVAIQPMEGVSLAPLLNGRRLQRESPLGFEHHGNLALRHGRWKIVSTYRRNQPRQWELYDMWNARTELNDLAKKQPERLKVMVKQWQDWADRVGVKEWPFKNGPK